MCYKFYILYKYNNNCNKISKRNICVGVGLSVWIWNSSNEASYFQILSSQPYLKRNLLHLFICLFSVLKFVAVRVWCVAVHYHRAVWRWEPHCAGSRTALLLTGLWVLYSSLHLELLEPGCGWWSITETLCCCGQGLLMLLRLEWIWSYGEPGVSVVKL